MEERPCLTWILGSSRSGSTWLLRMLGDLDGVVGIDDPHLGHHLELWRPIPLAWAAAAGDPELTTLRELKRGRHDYFFSDRYADSWRPALRDLIVSRFMAQARDVAPGHAGPRIVVKEPGSQAAGLLTSLFPESNLIFLLRDGRDVVDSWLDAYQSGSWAQEGGAFAVAPHGRIPLIRWLASVWLFRTEAVQAAYSAHDAGRRLLVRYERLLEAGAAELGRVATLLNVEASPAMLEGITRAHRFSAVASAKRGRGKQTRAATPGRWRTSLSAAEQDALMAILGEKLAELSYEPATDSGTGSAMVA